MQNSPVVEKSMAERRFKSGIPQQTWKMQLQGLSMRRAHEVTFKNSKVLITVVSISVMEISMMIMATTAATATATTVACLMSLCLNWNLGPYPIIRSLHEVHHKSCA
jgi:pyridoxine 5'-phosphate synthase PdxJ